MSPRWQEEESWAFFFLSSNWFVLVCEIAVMYTFRVVEMCVEVEEMIEEERSGDCGCDQILERYGPSF